MYVTGVNDRVSVVEKSLDKQLGKLNLLSMVFVCMFLVVENLRMYLEDADQSMEFKEKLTAIDAAVEIEYYGNQAYKQIQILRMGGENLDNNCSTLFRLLSDGAPTTSGPFIMAVEVDRSFHYDLWVEQTRLLLNMTLPEAIAAYIHLAFVCGIEYPEESQTVSHMLQILVARYGDDSGKVGPYIFVRVNMFFRVEDKC